jgi:alkaline phosphatase
VKRFENQKEKMKNIFLVSFISFCTLIIAHEENFNDEEWAADDPRWDTKIPNWWDEANFVPPVGPIEERTRNFWVQNGQNLLKQKINHISNFNKAKNLVIFIGDGMGISTQMAARAYMDDERSELSFEKFPVSGLSKTYCINYQVSESACTATAILSGIKINYNVVSLSGEVNVRDCSSARNNQTHIDSILKYAQDAGKATGIVTNTRITHATPAAAYAKSASRYWESNNGVPEGCTDISHQLIHGETGSRFDVIMGGGRRSFLPTSAGGIRTDNRNLIAEYEQLQSDLNKKAAVVQNWVR